MVLTTPMLRSLRHHEQGATITLLHALRTTDIVRYSPHIDHRIVYDKSGGDRGTGSFLSLVRKLSGKRFDLVLSPHRSIRSGLLALFTGAPRRIGFAHPSSGLFYTDTVPYSRWESTFVRRKLDLLLPLGIDEENETPEIAWSDKEETEVSALLKSGGVRSPFAVLAVGSAWETKRWPPERFAELVVELERIGLQAVAVGGPTDREAGRSVSDAGGVDITGKTSLTAVSALLHRASLFVGNDSGALHMARAARTPAIGLFGPTGPEQFRFDSQVRIIRSEVDCAPCSDHGARDCPTGNWICMPGISAAHVARVACELMESRR